MLKMYTVDTFEEVVYRLLLLSCHTYIYIYAYRYIHIHIHIPMYTLSGRIGKVVASHAAVARSIPLRCTDLYYARGAQGVLPCVGWGVRPVNWIYRL